jgi:hypothetical protein
MLRRHILAMTLGAAALAAPSIGGAQTAIDGPRGRFEDDLISKLEGEWRITRQIRGTTVENAARATWVLNHQFLQLHMKDVASPPKYEAIVLLGYIYSDKQYVAYWTDTFGAKYAGVGRGVRSGDSVEFRFDYQDGPFFNTFTWFPERRQWVSRMESQGASGNRQLFAIDTFSPLK